MQKLTKLQEDFCKALESGKFPKTIFFLHTISSADPINSRAIGKWCVLGVACEVSKQGAWRQQIDMDYCIYEPKKKGARDESRALGCPLPVVNKLRLYGPYGRIAREFIGSAEDRAMVDCGTAEQRSARMDRLNDDTQYTFEEMAGLIRRWPRAFFRPRFKRA